MADQSLKNNQFSWDIMRGYSVVLLAFAFLPMTLGTEGGLTTALGLILISSAWIGFSILPLFGRNRTTFVFVANIILIAVGIGIGGLGIATILEILFSETQMSIANNWVLGVASMLAYLAVMIWSIVILKVSPDSLALRMSMIFFTGASSYPVGYGICALILSIGQDTPQMFAGVGQGLAAVFSGGAIIVWTLLITRKIVHSKVRFVVPTLVICGIGFIGIGISYIVDAV